MAIDPKKAKDDKKATDEKAPDATGNENSQKKKKLFMIIGVAVALVTISIGGTIFALKMLTPSSETGEEAAEVEEVKVLAPAIYQTMKPNFTINFNVKGRQRYLQAELTLMYRDPLLDPLLTLHMPAIRNGLVMLFSSKNFDELQTAEGKEILRTEALAIVQNLLIKEQEALAAAKKAAEGDDEEEDDEDDEKDKEAKKAPEYSTIEQVLFTNFVMQ